MSANRRWDTISLAVKLLAFAGLSAVLTTIVVTSVLDLDTSPSTTYKALFSDVSGLQADDTVRIAGVEVGKVSSVDLLHGSAAARCGTNPPSTTCAEVVFAVNSNQHLTSTTKAAIFFENLLGERFLGLVPGASGGATLPGGSTIPMSMTQPGLDLTAVFNGFEPLFNALNPTQVNELSSSIIQIFQGQSGTVSNLVAETAAITSNLANRQQILNEVLQNLAGLLNAVNGQGTQLGQLIDNFNHLVSGLAGERSQIGTTITGLASLNTTVAGLLQQSQPALNQSISGLASATATLSTDQDQLNGVVTKLPGLLNALMKTVSTGNYLDVYICNLTLDINGELNISLIPGVPAPQYPSPLTLPSGKVGDQTQHTAVCKS